MNTASDGPLQMADSLCKETRGGPFAQQRIKGREIVFVGVSRTQQQIFTAPPCQGVSSITADQDILPRTINQCIVASSA